MKAVKKTIVLVGALLFAAPVVASDACALGVSDVRQTFFVSGILQKDGETVTVKLVHSVERAESSQEAMVVFVKQVAKEYPAYKMVDILASPADDAAKASCIQPVRGVSI